MASKLCGTVDDLKPTLVRLCLIVDYLKVYTAAFGVELDRDREAIIRHLQNDKSIGMRPPLQCQYLPCVVWGTGSVVFQMMGGK